MPVLASTLRPAADTSNYPWIIDATLIPVHDQSAHRRRVILAGKCWPGNRNDVIVARATLAHLLTATRQDSTGPIIRDHRYRTHRRSRAGIEHVIARLKDCQTLRQCRRRGDAISHTLQIIAGLWNLKTHTQLRVKS